MPFYKTVLPVTALVLVALRAGADQSHVAWKATFTPLDARVGEAALVVLTATIELHYHLYSLTSPAGGPIPTSIAIKAQPGLTVIGKPLQPPFTTVHDPNFNLNLQQYTGTVTFAIPVRIARGATGSHKASVAVNYQVCNEKVCFPPTLVSVPVSYTVPPGSARPGHTAPITRMPPQQPVRGSPGIGTPLSQAPAAGVPGNRSTEDSIKDAEHSGILSFAWISLVAGFAALFTPCVFPMIPITVSIFTKRRDQPSGGGLKAPIVYCLGIISTFTGLGIFMSVVFGAASINRFASNPIVNIGLATLFIILAANLFGVFEIGVPTALINRTQKQSRSAGLIGPFLMGITFTLTSFTCTVPFVGTILVSASQGSFLYPLVGMLAFSTMFSAPFFLLALFPQALSRLPRSGAWLITVKAAMGFLELAFALKFVSNVDLSWSLGFITRPVFLAVWSTILVTGGLYLFGWLKLPHDDKGGKIGPTRRVLGLLMATAGVYCLAAIQGAPLWQASAFPPPDPYPGRLPTSAEAVRWLSDYPTAVARARQSGRLILINFTGVTCVNCRQMEATVLPNPEVVAQLRNYVTVELYTDRGRTDDRQNQAFESKLINSVALPEYVVVDADSRLIAHYDGQTDVRTFTRFLAAASTGTHQTALR